MTVTKTREHTNYHWMNLETTSVRIGEGNCDTSLAGVNPIKEKKYLAWKAEETALLAAMRGRRLHLAGDGRADSPGYSAKHGTYSLLDTNANKILHFETVQDCLTAIAVMHYNQNSDRKQATAKDNKKRLALRYPKSRKGNHGDCVIREGNCDTSLAGVNPIKEKKYLAWKAEETALLAAMRGRRLHLAGDGRADSPGYSAKHGTYSLLDTNANKILHFETVQDCLTAIAVMHYNQNSNRKQATAKDNKKRLALRYPKSRKGNHGDCVIRQCPEAAPLLLGFGGSFQEAPGGLSY
ncbi:uncharacterized protein ISCGN_004706 [Ixodes scapularis]